MAAAYVRIGIGGSTHVGPQRVEDRNVEAGITPWAPTWLTGVGKLEWARSG